MLAITYYMPGKPVSLLLISRYFNRHRILLIPGSDWKSIIYIRVIFGFGGEAIIMCQQVMLARWFSGLSLVLASGFVQLFVLCVGSGGAFLFLPHFDEGKSPPPNQLFPLNMALISLFNIRRRQYLFTAHPFRELLGLCI